MSFEAPQGQTIIAAVVSLLTGGGIAKLVEVASRRRPREVHALSETIGTLQSQLAAQDTRMDAFSRRLDECNAKHEACERDRTTDRRRHSREMAGLRLEIERLMQGPIANYGDKPPEG